MAAAKYAGFAAFIVFAGTGIAVGYTGATLLTAYVAYLSPWLPAWLWLAVAALMGLGVAISATSVVGAIAAIAPKPSAFKLCSRLLVLMAVGELVATGFVLTEQNQFGSALSNHMAVTMYQSQTDYSLNISDTQLWDEIQTEMNCCGVVSYQDWLGTTFGNGTDVPDSCCLLISEGCGKGIVNEVDPEDEIITEGCLPTILSALANDYITLGKGIWLPVLVLHIVLGLILLACAKAMPPESFKNSNLRAFSIAPPATPTANSKYQTLREEF